MHFRSLVSLEFCVLLSPRRLFEFAYSYITSMCYNGIVQVLFMVLSIGILLLAFLYS